MIVPNMSTPEVCQYTASDGYRLHYRRWLPMQSQPSGYVVALHGIQSHSGWYDYSSSRLCRAGYVVNYLDRRGSGLNLEARGHAVHHDRLINDVVQFLSNVKARRDRESPNSPIILLGTSWGGKLSVVTCARRPDLVDALGLLYPGVCARIRPRWYHQIALKFAELLGVRRQMVPVPLDEPRLFTAESRWQEFIRNDSLLLHRASISFLLANRELDRLAARAPARIRCPVLVMLAGQDRIIDNESTRRYLNRFASWDRKLIEYLEAQHTLEFEPNRQQVVDDLLNWLDAQSRPVRESDDRWFRRDSRMTPQRPKMLEHRHNHALS